eukprot:3713789-Alexandrium_andersonii.AAC.1
MADAPARMPRRPNRSAAERRQQYRRAEARALGLLLRQFEALDHRGARPTRLGAALHAALRATDYGSGDLTDSEQFSGARNDD